MSRNGAVIGGAGRSDSMTIPGSRPRLSMRPRCRRAVPSGGGAGPRQRVSSWRS
jgi:hypothetical protein